MFVQLMASHRLLLAESDPKPGPVKGEMEPDSLAPEAGGSESVVGQAEGVREPGLAARGHQYLLTAVWVAGIEME